MALKHIIIILLAVSPFTAFSRSYQVYDFYKAADPFQKKREHFPKADRNFLDKIQSIFDKLNQDIENADLGHCDAYLNAVSKIGEMINAPRSVSFSAWDALLRSDAAMSNDGFSQCLKEGYLEKASMIGHSFQAESDYTNSVSRMKLRQDFLVRIMDKAEADGNLAIAMEAARAADMLDKFVLKYLQVENKPSLSFKMVELQPRIFRGIPSQAQAIYNILRENSWELPGFTVIFDTYGSKNVVYYKVNEIRGPNFVLGFGLIQGRVSDSWNFNDTAGLNFIANPKFAMEFYQDNSGPTVYSYEQNDCGETQQELSLDNIWGEQNGWVTYYDLPKHLNQFSILVQIRDHFEKIALPSTKAAAALKQQPIEEN